MQAVTVLIVTRYANHVEPMVNDFGSVRSHLPMPRWEAKPKNRRRDVKN